MLHLIDSCPICNKSEFEPFLEVKDHMITQEMFHLVSCKGCGFHFTNPIPTKESIGEYYKSEEYVSHSSNKRGIVNFLYSIVRKRTLKQKVNWVKNEIIGNDILDIGCGTGHFLRVAKSKGFHVLGLEPDADARSFAKDSNKVNCRPLEELYTLHENTIDAITMWHVLEHVYDLQKDVQQMHKLLKSTGKLFVAVPNMESFDAKYYDSFWAAYDVPRHLYHFRKRDISRLMLDQGFDLKKIIPMRYDAYYVSMLSEKYKKGSFLRALFIGWKSNRMASKNGFSSQVYVFEKK